tara:strand:+ start:334 stop:501 length:168 start_codon:yes stop_codon:yes gene_type:complete
VTHESRSAIRRATRNAGDLGARLLARSMLINATLTNATLTNLTLTNPTVPRSGTG